MLGQSPDRPAPGRSRPARLRPDVVSHRPVPARLPELPRDRGSARQRPRFLPFRRGRRDRPARRRATASARRSDSQARDYTRQDLIADLDSEFGPDAVRRGRRAVRRQLRALPFEPSGQRRPTRSRIAISTPWRRTIRARCARTSSATTRRRRSTEVGTFRCRALHSNHMRGPPLFRVRLRNPAQPAGGRRHSRARENSRTTVAATTAISRCSTSGRRRRSCTTTRSVPEICGKPKNAENDFFRSRYVDASGKLVDPQPACMRLRPERRGPLRALQAVDARAVASEGARHQADADR